jgi:hypothetical protein
MGQQNRTLKPCETLELLNEKIRISLSQQDNRNSDGMDICLCKINLKTHQVWFSGAKRPLYITKQGMFIKNSCIRLCVFVSSETNFYASSEA